MSETVTTSRLRPRTRATAEATDRPVTRSSSVSAMASSRPSFASCTREIPSSSPSIRKSMVTVGRNPTDARAPPRHSSLRDAVSSEGYRERWLFVQLAQQLDGDDRDQAARGEML